MSAEITINQTSLPLSENLRAVEALKQAGALTDTTIAAKLDGTVIDLTRELTTGGTLETVDISSEEGLNVLRHSAAHIMAQAVMRLYPTAKLAIGPTVENGFYYDIDFGEEAFSSEDFKKIEAEMKKISKKKLPVERKVLSREEALAMWEEQEEIYKVDLVRDLPEGETITTYSQGEFTDLCRGPHIQHTGRVKFFKLMSVAGAYWRGDEKNKMLTRIYATAWPSKEELQDYLKRLEEAEKRDHRKINKVMELYHIDDDIGKGLILWLPNGTVLREELERFAKEKEFEYGYDRVYTPHITKENLYQTSGHLEHYKDSMFPPMKMPDEEEDYYLKPMNCPHHHKIFAARPRSYRDMPLRLSEYGQVYRYEKSGELAGLLRVRGLCMNDAHVYCTEEQLGDEFKRVMQLHLDYYKTLNLTNYYMRLSLHDPEKDKFVTDHAMWKRAEDACQNGLDEMGLDYKVVRGEAAFYGPKVDVQFKNVVGREETNSTNQVDFLAAEKFKLRYVGTDGKEYSPVVLHRAPLGTHERFISFLIEHFAGAFPTWLAPEQVRLIPVGQDFVEYARNLQEDLRKLRIRVTIDDGGDSLNKKIRNAVTKMKVPNLLILGAKERENQAVTLRRYGLNRQESMSYEAFKAWLLEQIATRALPERDTEE